MGSGQLIFDIGFHNGDDTAYYLSRGHPVVAIEANPVLAQAGQKRFSSEIAAGRLNLLNVGVWHTGGASLNFYVNDTDSGWSSFDPEKGQRKGKFHMLEIQCQTLSGLFQNFGVHWYLKVDIEGADLAVVQALTAQASPEYMSCELEHGSSIVGHLESCGYTGFKLINQETYSQCLPVFQHEIGIRAMRKASTVLPAIRSAISLLPAPLRPRKILWDRFREEFPYEFSSYSSGPFAEDTEGEWVSPNEMKAHLTHVFDQHTRDGESENFWFDLHARKK